MVDLPTIRTNIFKIDNDQHDEAYNSQLDRQLGLSTRLDYTKVMALRAQVVERCRPRSETLPPTSHGSRRGHERGRSQAQPFSPAPKVVFFGTERVERE